MILKYIKKIEYRHIILGVVFILLAIPFLNFSCIMHGDDEIFHLSRIKTLAMEIKNLNIPCFFSGYRLDGYGCADFTFYPYATLFVPAIIYLLTNNIIIAFNIYCMIIQFLMMYIMYISSYEIFKDVKISTIASIYYVLNYYTLWDVYTRYALGEKMALAFLPLLIAGFYNVFFGNKKKWYYIVISFTMISMSHLITLFFATLMSISFCLIMIKDLMHDKQVLKILVKCIIIVLLLNIGFYYPFLYSYFIEKYKISVVTRNLELLNPLTAFVKLPFIDGLVSLNNIHIAYKDLEKYADPFSSLSVIDFVLILVTGIYLLVNKVKKKDNSKMINVAVICYIVFIIYIVLYSGIVTLVPIINNIFNVQQFNYRFLGRGLVFITLAFSYVLSKVLGSNIKVFLPALCLLLLINGFSNVYRNIIRFEKDQYIDLYGEGKQTRKYLSFKGKIMLVGSSDCLFDVKDDKSLLNCYSDYVPINKEYSWIYNNQVHMDNISITGDSKAYLEYTAQVSVIDKTKNGIVILPFFKVRGFSATIDDNNNEIVDNPYGLVSIYVSGNTENAKLHAKYNCPLDYLFAFYISLFSYLFVFVILIKRYSKVKI